MMRGRKRRRDDPVGSSCGSDGGEPDGVTRL